jgi:hypothetical protein
MRWAECKGLLSRPSHISTRGCHTPITKICKPNLKALYITVCQSRSSLLKRGFARGTQKAMKQVGAMQMLLGIFSARGVLPLEFKPAYSVGDSLLQHLPLAA